MTAIKQITHLVHIGFDSRENTEFIEKIKERIRIIADEVDHLLCFANEPNNTLDEIQHKNVFELAQRLRDFMHGYNVLSWFSCKDFSQRMEMMIRDKTPSPVLDYIEKRVWEKARYFWKPIEWYFEAARFFDPPSAEVRARIQDRDGEFQQFLETEFIIILRELIELFWDTNVFDFPVSERYDNPQIDVQKPERYHEIRDFAIERLWEERILYFPMWNYDMHNFHHLHKYADEKRTAEDEIYFEAKKHLILLRLDRFQQYIHGELEKRGYLHAKHTVWGEYYGACVQNYPILVKRILRIPWVFQVDQSISLISPSAPSTSSSLSWVQ